MDIQNKKYRQEIYNSCACFNLRRAARLITRRYESGLKSTGLKATQFPLLLAACDKEGILLTKMARLLGMDRTSLTRNLNTLTMRGLLTVEMGEDKRERRISITPKGLELLEAAVPLWQKVQRDVVQALGPDKWSRLLSGLQAVTQKN
jgi:DNA-binding MarR family transcriptional regulator